MSRIKYVYGNWKMNQGLKEIETFFEELSENQKDWKCVFGIAPQFLHLPKLLNSTQNMNVKVGAQNCSHKESGAFTGDISPASLKELGCDFVIIGHSERRAFFKESHEVINEKTKLALSLGLEVVFCIGETLEQREAGKVEEVLKEQITKGLEGLSAKDLENVVIAYEPVWAIGTGVTATPEQAEETHAMIRSFLDSETAFEATTTSILYGGSVKPSNVEGLLSNENIDGALVGGASLKAKDFNALCEEASKLS